jgi:Uma2 family endonuclease
LESVREGGAFLSGQKKPSRRFEIRSSGIRAIRERTSLSQSEFAHLIEETRYRVSDVLVMTRPFRQTDRVLDPPWLIVEILSPDDTTRDTLRRFREDEKLGVRYIVQMDPEDRTTHQFTGGDLVHRDLTSLKTLGGGSLPFDTRELLSRLDEEPGEQ